MSRPSCRRLPVLTLCTLLAGLCPARADEPANEAVVFGVVVDEAGAPVSGVTVAAPSRDNSLPVKTGLDGSYRLPLGYPAREYLYAVLLAEAPDGRLGVV